MRTLGRSAILISLASIALGCVPAKELEKKSTVQPIVSLTAPAPQPRWLSQRELSPAEPLAGLVEACAKTEGAVFDSAGDTCECLSKNSQGKVFVPNDIYKPKLGGLCVELQNISEEASSDSTHYWMNSAHGSILSTFFDTSSPLDSDRLKTLTELPVRSWNPFLMSGYSEMVTLRVGNQRLLVQQSGLALDQYKQLTYYRAPGVFNKDPQLAFQRATSRLLYSPSWNELPLALGALRYGQDHLDPGQYQLDLRPSSLNLSSAHTKASEVARSAYQSYLDHDLSEKTFESASDAGCLGFCTIRTAINLSIPLKQAGYSAQEVRIISQGTLAHHLLRVEGPENRLSGIEALIMLNRGGVLSTMSLLESVETSQDRKIQLRVFDRHWSEMTPESPTNTPDGSFVQFASQDESTWRDRLRSPKAALTEIGSDEYPVVICEDQFSPAQFEKAGVLSSFFIGSKAESVFGWSQNESLDAWVNLNSNGETDWNNQKLSSHSLAVTQAMLQLGSKSRVLPMSANRCMGLALTDFSALKEKQARVINVSFIGPKDDSICKEQSGKRLQELSQESHLWVLASGNDGINKDYTEKVWLCPQSYFANRENGILVAGMMNGVLWGDSNSGENYADIAADASSQMGPGTSFAAPRVSAVAAELFGKYPKLTPKQVRLAILLSADIPLIKKGEGVFTLKTLPVRSGGQLNKAKALLAGKQLSEATSFDLNFYTTLLEQLNCSPDEFSETVETCKEVIKARYALLQRSGIMQEDGMHLGVP